MKRAYFSVRGVLALALLAALTGAGCNCGGPARSIAFTAQPEAGTAGATLNTVQVSLLDDKGQVLTGSTATVTLTLTGGASGAVLGGTLSAAAVKGVATFSDLSLQKAGSDYVLVASSEGVDSASSNPFAISPAAANKLEVVTGPAESEADSPLSPVIEVAVADAFANRVSSSTVAITAALGANPAGGTLAGTTTVKAVGGLAKFTELSIDKASDGYTLTFSSPGLPAITSSPFKVRPGPAAKLAFTTQPSDAAAGAGISPAVQVTVQDRKGNATRDEIDITLALDTNPASGMLSGTTTVRSVAGVATFPGLSVDKAATGYTLKASSAGVSDAISSAFAISPGAAAKLAFTRDPTNATAGASLSPAVQVTVQDAFGNPVTTSTASVTVSLATNPAGGTLGGTLTASAVSGVATFSTLNIRKAGAGYQLGAASTGLTAAISAAFDITPGAATRLAFTGQASNAVAGESLAPAVVVTAQDAFGNTATSFTGGVTVALNATNGATLFGTPLATAVAGEATFADLSVQKAGTGYTLAATSGTLATATSRAFNITPAAGAALAFSAQPNSAVAGATLSAVSVTILDAFGNMATGSAATVSLSFGTNPTSATLLGTLNVSAVSGVARFTDLSVQRAGTGYTLLASSGALRTDISSAFNITAGTANRLAFTTQPSAATAGVAFNPSVAVTVQDTYGNTVTGARNITVDISANPGGATLFGTKTQPTAGGVATFPGLNVQKAGTGYTLTATATGLTGSTSAGFDVSAGASAKLIFTTQPANAEAGAALDPSVAVTIQDQYGNTATSATDTVTVALATNPGGATLFGTTSVSATAGVATFTDINVRKAGTGYVISASSGALTGANSSAFAITAASASQLAFTRQPSNATAGASINPAVALTIQDAYGNTVTTSTASVTVDLATNPAGATLFGTTTRAAVAGVASFNDLNVRKVGTGYSLTASSGTLTGASSSGFDIAPGAASKVAFSGQPSNAVAGVPFSPAVSGTIQDAYGNTVTTSTTVVVVGIAANPSGATLSGTTTRAAVAGVVTFPDINVRKAGTGYNLTLASGALTGDSSSAFDIAADVPAALAFGAQPSTATAGASINPSVTVRIVDQYGNSTGGSDTVTIALGANPGGDTLNGTLTRTASGGTATFDDLSLRRAASGYTLSASSGALATVTSAAFDVVPAAASALQFTVQPSSANLNAPINPAVKVAAIDPYGNANTSFTGAVTLSLSSGTGTLGGTLSQNAVSGVATFNDLTVDASGSGKVLQASAPPLTAATSNPFAVFMPVLVYTDPSPTGKVALVKNPSSTDTTVVLDLVTTQAVTGYSVGLNLPTDASKVQPASPLMVSGPGLSPGTGSVAAKAVLAGTGPANGMLFSGQSQKASGAGAISTDTPLAAGTVLYQLRLDIKPTAGAGVVFDGTTPDPRVAAALRDKLGNDVAALADFRIGKLEVQLQ